MAIDSNAASVVCLAKIAFSNVPPESPLHNRLKRCFPLFSEILPFDSPLDLENFFTSYHLSCVHSVHTFYGTIRSCVASWKLQQLHIQRTMSLQNLCLMSLIRTSPPHMTFDILLALPDNIFREFIAKSFSVLWLPMSHALFHRNVTDRDVPVDLKTVFDFLCDVDVFERMYSCCRDLQIFIASWLQHAHFYSTSGSDVTVPFYVNPLGRNPDVSPLVPAHELSLQLLANLRELLSQTADANCNSITNVIRVVLFGLNVANFLCDCSEYVHAYKAAHFLYGSIRTFTGFSQYRCAQIRLQYNVLCVMLRAMNAYNMYIDPEDRQLFQKDGPNLLKSMKHHGLLLDRTSLDAIACSPFVLPPSLQATNASLLDAHTDQSISADQCLEHQSSENPDSLALSCLGPSGDVAQLKVHDCDSVLPPPVLSKCYFRQEHIKQAAVFDLLNEFSSVQMSGAFLYAQLAAYYHSMCKYQIAHQFTLLSVEQLRASYALKTAPSVHVTIEVLRIMCKICMIKRKYEIGLRIIRLAIDFAKMFLGSHNLVYASLMLEHGCLMLNMDKTRTAGKTYLVSMAKILNCLPGSSIMAALALEAIAYACYVQEYTSGDFPYALNCAEVAVLMLRRLNHETCMQTSSANRVKALIIEEIAIDDSDLARSREFLYVARNLHLESLSLCERTFGLWNIQTAKHFGNLGRLYQSMQENKEAEMMHRKAIMVKERLLGTSDFEVGLSAGHLASLYNYDMDRYKEAEELYLRSVQISLNLFGPTYSGLEYDYRGLMHVYRELGNQCEVERYRSLYESWQRARENVQKSEPLEPEDESESSFTVNYSEEVLWDQFFQIASDYEVHFKGVFFASSCAAEESQASSSVGCGNRASGHGL